MIVPIDLLKPILDDLLTLGRRNNPPRPWLGLYATEVDDRIVVVGLPAGARPSAPTCGPATSCWRSAAPRSTISPGFSAASGRSAMPASRCR